MWKKRVMALLSTVLLASGLIAGCGNSGQNTIEDTTVESEESQETASDTESQTTEILFWHSYSEPEEKVFTEEVLPAFEEQHPEIKVNVVRMPYEGMDEQIVTAVSGDAAPDVIRMDITWVSQMAKLGALEKLDDYDGFTEIKDRVLENTLQTNLYGGNYYGLPLNSNTTVAIFNKQRLEELGFSEVPDTLDELLNAADKADPANEKWLFAVQGSYNWAMLPFIWTLGGTLTNDDFTIATGYLNSPETVAALETINQWYKDGIIGPCILGDEPDIYSGMESGGYGMIVDGPWYFSASDTVMETTTPALIPSVEGRSISILGGENIVMTSISKNKDAAWTFMKFLMEDEQQVNMAKAGMIPTVVSAMEKVDTTQAPYTEVYMEQLKTANPRTPSAAWPTIENILNQTFERVLRGEVDAQEALDQAAEEIDALLAEEG